MIDEQKLRAALRASSWELPAPANPVMWVRRRARRQRITRAGLALGVLAVLSGGAVLVWQVDGTDRLVPADHGAGALAVRVVSAALRPPVPGLTVSAASFPVLLDGPYPGVSLTWTTTGADRLVPDSRALQVSARTGRGVLTLVAAGTCRPEQACVPLAGPPSSSVLPGTPRRTSLLLDPSTTAPGEYDVRLPVPQTASELQVTVRVVAAAGAATGAYETVNGTLSSDRPSQPLIISPGVPAGVTFTDTRTGQRWRTQSFDGTFRSSLPSGTYALEVGTYQGFCPQEMIQVTRGRSTRIELACSP